MRGLGIVPPIVPVYGPSKDGMGRLVEPDSRTSWLRLAILVLTATIGAVGMWSVVVTLPAVQAEFGVARAAAALPYTLTMIGVAFGSVLLGRAADRLGIAAVIAMGAACLSIGYVGAAFTTSLWQYALIHGLLIGLGSAATFGPVMTEASYWFARHRGLAVSICASGNYLAGALWPSRIEHFVRTSGWRTTEIGIGAFCLLAMLPLAVLLRGRRPTETAAPSALRPTWDLLGFSPNGLLLLLVAAGFSCCVAMAMPQVHIVAYCGDLGYGAARGTQMLALMLGCGVVSRIGSGWVADRIGGVRTLLLGSALQALSLSLYLTFESLPSLYLISALFGLVQGGLVPSYAIIVRECFPAREAGVRFGFVLMASLLGMAFGGWISGWVFDLTLSYAAAFANGILWNGFNIVMALVLVTRQRRTPQPAFA
jgi:MFS family permease